MVTTTPTLDKAAQVAHSIDVGPTNNDQLEPKVVMLDDGRFVVVWTDNSDAAPGGHAGTDILAQVFDAFGNAVGSIQEVNNGWFNDNEGEFSVAALPGGRFVVAYEDTDASGTSIRATEVTVAGNASMTFANRSILLDPGAEELGDPEVSARSDGSYVVVYAKTTADTDADFFGKVVSAAGVVGAEFPLLTNSDDTGDERNGVATLTNGNYVTVHSVRQPTMDETGDRGMFFRIIDSTGAGVKGITEVGTTYGDTNADTQPVIAALTGGGFVIVWTNNDGTDSDIIFQLYDSAGQEVGGLHGVHSVGSDQENNEPAVVALNDGGFFVVYDDDKVGVDQITGQRYNSMGNTVGGAVTIAATAGTELAPTLSLTSDGRILVAWVEDNGGNGDTKFAIYDPREPLLNGDANNNVILGRLSEASTINGLGGDDVLYGRNGADSVSGGLGDDTVGGGAGADTLDGGDGNDWVSYDDAAGGVTVNIATQTAGGDAAGDVLVSIENVIGSDFGDSLVGADGAQSMVGGAGADTITGAGGDDTLDGGAGDDTIGGEAGRDSMFGGDGADTMHGFGSHDSLYGGNGDDDLRGGYGKDLLGGSGDNDVLRGFEGDDRLFGGGGNDTLFGNDGNDSLIGGGGADRLKGDAGNDTLNGLFGNDTLTGGDGDDTFEFRKTHGADVIDDFVAGAATDDAIQLVAFGAAFDTFAEVMAAATQVGMDVFIDFGAGDTLTLTGVTLGDLHQSDFVF